MYFACVSQTQTCNKVNSCNVVLYSIYIVNSIIMLTSVISSGRFVAQSLMQKSGHSWNIIYFTSWNMPSNFEEYTQETAFYMSDE